MASRHALLIATESYADPALRRLTAPGGDARELAAVLSDPAIAGFEVTTLVDQPHHVVGEATARRSGSRSPPRSSSPESFSSSSCSR